jgi:5-methylthioadenosine/S-adenosylhomocysteine deaminase
MATAKRSFAMTDCVPASCDLIVEHAVVLTLDREDRVLSDGAVAVAGSRIVAVGPSAELNGRYRADLRIDARGGLLLPGLINIHNHTPLAITRGMVEDLGHAPAYTPGIPQGAALSAEEAYLLARLGAYELLRAGSTTAVDYYRYPESCARAFAELGLRAVVGGRVHDADPAALADGRREHRTDIGEATLAENAALIETWDGKGDGRIRCDWAPHAADTCSADLLRQVARLGHARPGNIHTHLAQSQDEVDYVRARDGLRPTELFDACGLLDRRLIAGHCLFVDEDEILRLGRAGIAVAHCPIGNAKSGGIAPVLALAEAGATIALGTDAFSGDLFEAMRWALAVARIRGARFEPTARTVLSWATTNAALALGFGDRLGRIAEGYHADLVLLDADAPCLAPVVDGFGIVVHSGSGLAVDTAIVDGRVLIRGGAAALVDGGEIVRSAQAVADRLWRHHGFRPVGRRPA